MQRLGWPEQQTEKTQQNSASARSAAQGQDAGVGQAQQPAVVGCHVRRGDKVGGGRAGRFVVGMEVYKRELAAVVQRTRPATVVLAGDDLETLTEMMQYCTSMVGIVCVCACVCMILCVRVYV